MNQEIKIKQKWKETEKYWHNIFFMILTIFIEGQIKINSVVSSNQNRIKMMVKTEIFWPMHINGFYIKEWKRGKWWKILK